MTALTLIAGLTMVMAGAQKKMLRWKKRFIDARLAAGPTATTALAAGRRVPAGNAFAVADLGSRRLTFSTTARDVSVASACVQPLEEEAASIVVGLAVRIELLSKIVEPDSEIVPARKIEPLEEAAAAVCASGLLPQRTACAGADLVSTEALLDPARP